MNKFQSIIEDAESILTPKDYVCSYKVKSAIDNVGNAASIDVTNCYIMAEDERYEGGEYALLVSFDNKNVNSFKKVCTLSMPKKGSVCKTIINKKIPVPGGGNNQARTLYMRIGVIEKSPFMRDAQEWLPTYTTTKAKIAIHYDLSTTK